MVKIIFVVLIQSASAASLQQLVAEALEKNPEIAAAQKRYEAARQRPVQERSLPDPALGVGYNSNGYPLPGAGLGRDPTSNIGFMLTQDLPQPGKLRTRALIASKEADAAYQDYVATRHSIVQRVTTAHHKLHHTYASQEILGRYRELLTHMLKVTEARYAAGRAAQQDVLRAQTQISLMVARLMQVRRELRSVESELNSLLARPQRTPVAEPEFVDYDELPFTLEQLQQRLGEHSPMLLREEKMIERAESSVSLARKGFQPDYAITGGYYNMGSMPPMYMFRADVKLPITFRKLRAAVTEQNYTLEASRRTYESTAQSLRARIAADYEMADAANKIRKLYKTTIIPQASLTFESSLASYETGAVDFSTVLSNYMAIVESELMYHEQTMDFHLAVARMEEMAAVSEVLK
jgi:cobalt-zinc-cadmium efflux system outer membrane protein